MTHLRPLWIALGMLVCVALASCGGVTKDYGYGPCQEYEPVCLDGELVCTVGDKGCRTCSCSGGFDRDPPGPTSRTP